MYEWAGRFWRNVMPFLLAILVTEWAAIAGVAIGDAIKGGWT